MITNSSKLLMSALLFTVLVGCQSKKTKPEQPIDEAMAAETMAFGWTQLQQATLDNLRQQSYGEAEVNIKQMMAFAGKDHDKWEYIRMALVSMPDEIAASLVDQALTKPFINTSAAQQFAFSRVLTQLKQEQQAMDLINQVIELDKQSDYVYWRARLHLLLDNEELAEADYLWLLKQDPANADYIGQYSTLLSFLNRDEEALELLEQNEQDVDLLFRQIILLLQQDNQTVAEEKYELLKQMADFSLLDAEQKLEIGELSFWMKDYEYSMRLLETVKTGDQVNAAKLLIANILVAQKNFSRAAVMYHQVQNGPEQHAIPAYQLEIELHKQQDNKDEALAVANMGLNMFKDDSDLLYSRAMLFESMGDLESLEKDLKKILQNEPDNADAMNALGYTWADHDMNLDQAYDYIMKAHAIKPKDKAILDSVGWVYFKKGDLASAEKYLRLAVDGNLRDIESFQHLITVLKAMGKSDEVLEIEQQIIEIFPEVSENK